LLSGGALNSTHSLTDIKTFEYYWYLYVKWEFVIKIKLFY